MLPEAQYYKRQGYALKKIVKYATDRGFTDVMVFNENRKNVNGVLLIHLPGGPTAHFKLSNLVLGKDIKVRYLTHVTNPQGLLFSPGLVCKQYLIVNQCANVSQAGWFREPGRLGSVNQRLHAERVSHCVMRYFS